MKLPKDVLEILELLWTDEYESDYRCFIENEKPKQLLAKVSLEKVGPQKITEHK